MTGTFYRLHSNPAAPCFCVQHAYSALWGADFDVDGSRSRCPECDGTGESFGETCHGCGGEGWDDAQQGYSCCTTAAELIAYINTHGSAADTDPVVIFDGEQVGTGFDGEPLAIPTGNIRWTTFGALRAGKE